MNKTSIKAKASLKGYQVDSETDTKIVFSKTGKTITVDSSLNRITTVISGQKLFNFVTGDTIDQISKHLLK